MKRKKEESSSTTISIFCFLLFPSTQAQSPSTGFNICILNCLCALNPTTNIALSLYYLNFIILGAGSFCPLPFLFNNVFYDTCTRLKVDGSLNKVEEFYWCPSPDDVDKENDNLFLPNGKHGRCNDNLKPPGIFSKIVVA